MILILFLFIRRGTLSESSAKNEQSSYLSSLSLFPQYKRRIIYSLLHIKAYVLNVHEYVLNVHEMVPRSKGAGEGGSRGPGNEGEKKKWGA